MKIAILSGKGGTGKTLLSVNLAAVAGLESNDKLLNNQLNNQLADSEAGIGTNDLNSRGQTTYIDCDVEEPNGHLFLRPTDIETQGVSVQVPEVDQNLCNGCRLCVDFCRFNALAYIGDRLKIFEDICHSCGGCMLICPQHAFTEKAKPVGKIEEGMSDNVRVISGIMDIGTPLAVPIIDDLVARAQVLDMAGEDSSIFIDCPPGNSCSVIESIKDADYCLLVAEPTSFGAHNLRMVHQLVEKFGKKHGLILNKSMNQANPVTAYAEENNLKLLAELAFDYELGQLNSNGLIAARESDKYRGIFQGILDTIREEVETSCAKS